MKSRRTRAEDVLPNITARKPPKSSPGCGRMVPSAVVWRYLQRARYKTSCNRTDHSFAARRWWECTARFCPWWPWPLTLTFKLARVKDQTRLPREFGANPFSHSRDILFTKKQTKRQKSHRQREKHNLTQFTACGRKLLRSTSTVYKIYTKHVSTPHSTSTPRRHRPIDWLWNYCIMTD